ncbi:WXG100 family type VII secretion target [Streptacidiphilus jiangxiensis]|uniref:Uncharacterized conserved protein YukE n=1 Tax=Streptacidiphilus jiangxiensis TaxID=235985 RepID=A0A1H7RED0_STRJI|nr:hypothetical protein [Streptacidiphilus jiangxiensis]SEL58591.1 Uncharacterized conserved protein YukE [Streptacidiphilus jiangxiensis]
MRTSDGGGSWSPTTNFEQFSHAQLFDMVNESSPASISSIANTLNSASTQIQSIADDLNTHINQLPWEGTAADSFRTWGRQVVQAVDDLAIFHNNAGLAVQTAGDTLSSVKAGMPPVPTADINLVQNYMQQESCKIPSGPPTVIKGRVQSPSSCLPSKPEEISQSDAYAAQARVDAAHQEAVTQMEKLGGAYNGATQTMDVNTEPQFPPPPTGLMPPPGSGLDGSTTRSGSTGSSSGGAGVTGPSGRGGGGSIGRQPAQGQSVHRKTPTPSQPEGGTATLQGIHTPTSSPGSVKTPGPSGESSPGHSSSSKSGGTPPPGAGTGVLTPPARGGSTRRGGIGKGEPQPSDHPGEPGTGGGTSRGGIGGAKAGRPGGESVDRKAGVPGAEGTAGGSGTTRSALPSGEGGAVRAGSSTPGEAASGTATGSPTARAGLPSEESAGVRSGTAETAGGSGGPMMGGGMGGLGHAGSRSRGRSRRAPYYTEDAKTWATDSTSNPPVVPAGTDAGGRSGAAAEAIGGEAAGTSTERPEAPTEAGSEVRTAAGEGAVGATAGGPVVGSMGGLGHAVSGSRPRGRRGSYYAVDEDPWTSGPATNPAVIE